MSKEWTAEERSTAASLLAEVVRRQEAFRDALNVLGGALGMELSETFDYTDDAVDLELVIAIFEEVKP